jgi:hypothetical protein
VIAHAALFPALFPVAGVAPLPGSVGESLQPTASAAPAAPIVAIASRRPTFPFFIWSAPLPGS